MRRSLIRFSDIQLNKILEKKFHLYQEYNKEISKTSYHLAMSEKLQEEINQTTGEAAKYCDHKWLYCENEKISYCKVCGINDDYQIFGVRNRI